MSSSSPFEMPVLFGLRLQSVKTTLQSHMRFAEHNDASTPPQHNHQQHQHQQAMAMQGVDSANLLHNSLHSWMCLGAAVVAILSILSLMVWTMFKFCSYSESGVPWQGAMSEKEESYEESLQRTRQLLREMRDDGIDTDIF